jgi:hypothetical protein
MKFSFILLVIFLFATGCKRDFDRKEWLEGDGISFPYRESIVGDLLEQHPLKGLTYKQMTGLLGTPQGNTKTGVYYEIKVDYSPKADPDDSKYLICHLNKDSVITKAEIRNSRKP